MRILGGLSAVIFLILLLSASLSQVELGDFRSIIPSFDFSNPNENLSGGALTVSPILQMLLTVSLLILPLGLLYALRTRKGRLQLLALLFFIFVVMPILQNRLDQRPQAVAETVVSEGELEEEEEIVGLPAIPNFLENPPPAFSFLFALLLFSLVSYFLFTLWRRLKPTPDLVFNEIVHEVEEAIREIELGGDFREIILNCYAKMSRVLQKERGIARNDGMTAREFEAVLVERGVEKSAVSTLTRLFEQARYDKHFADEKAQDEALKALRQIEAQIGQRPKAKGQSTISNLQSQGEARNLPIT